MSAFDIWLKGGFVVFCFAAGLFFSFDWIRRVLSGEPVWEWGMSYYAGSICLCFALLFGMMFAGDMGWAL